MSFKKFNQSQTKRKFSELEGDLEFQQAKTSQVVLMPGRFFNRPTRRRFRKFFNSYRGRRTFSRFKSRKRKVSMIPRGFLNAAGSSTESKFYDHVLAAGSLFAIATTWTLTSVFLLPQGTDANMRIGRKVFVKACTYRHFVQSITGGTSTACLRSVLVYDKQPNGVIAAALDIFTVDGITGQLNLNNRERFIVLWDICGSRETNIGQLNTVDDCTYIKKFKKLNLPVQYNGTTSDPGTVGSIITGNFILCTAQNGQSTTGPQDTLNLRFRFTDD